MAQKYYAVRIGKKPGIYENWEMCKSMVHGYPNAQYKSFKTFEEAKAFMSDAIVDRTNSKEDADVKEQKEEVSVDIAFAFVDGSFNIATKTYGFGGFLEHDGTREILQGSGNDEEMASMRNVAGEILGSMAAMKKAIELNIKELNIYYDYMGIEMWAKGLWKRNKTGTKAYYDYAMSIQEQLTVHFIKVKGHSGIEGNEEADRLAKESVGILD